MINAGGRRRLAAAAWHLAPTRPRSRYDLLTRSQWWDPAELRRLQLEAARELLGAARRVPFHADRMAAAGIEPAELESLEELRRVPPLERADMQRLGPAGLMVPGTRGVAFQTSGSTGTPARIVMPLERRGWSDASDRRALDDMGVPLGGRRVFVTGGARLRKPRPRVRAFVMNTRLVDPFALSRGAGLASLMRSLRRNPPALLEGMSSSVQLLAERVSEAGLRLPPLACWTGGDHLYRAYRETIEAAFDTRVRILYGSWETGLLAYECGHGSLHEVAETAYIELVTDDGSPAEPGETGAVLVTDLRNRGMPLIRYRLGDLAVRAERECGCGRGLPILDRIVGRQNDLLRSLDGRTVPPAPVGQIMANAFPSVREYQVRQHTDLTITALVVQSDEGEPSGVRERISADLDELFGAPGTARTERVDELPLSPAGKRRHIVSEAEPTDAVRKASPDSSTQAPSAS